MEDIPNEIRTFFGDSIQSVDHLRILLLLYRSSPRVWDAWEVAVALYLKPDVATAGLAHLEAKGLLVAPNQSQRVYGYQAKTLELGRVVAQIAQMDQARPVTLINLIYAPSQDSAQAFSDAFKIRKEKEA